MHYREIHPRPPLNHFIECFWTLEAEATRAASTSQPILPDGCVEVILNLSAPFSELKEDGRSEMQPAHMLVGQMTRPVKIHPGGAVSLLGIRFHPGGTAPFLRQPMFEVTNRIVELAALDSLLEKELLSAISHFESWAARVSAIEYGLARRAESEAVTDGLGRVIARALQLNGNISVDQLASAAGISGRQLERRFREQVGIGPKTFCRILRFQHVLRSFDEESTSWAAVAVECGYYDQAHLIRDFQQFAQRTPAALLAQTEPLTEIFTRRHRMSHLSNTRA